MRKDLKFTVDESENAILEDQNLRQKFTGPTKKKEKKALKPPVIKPESVRQALNDYCHLSNPMLKIVYHPLQGAAKWNIDAVLDSTLNEGAEELRLTLQRLRSDPSFLLSQEFKDNFSAIGNRFRFCIELVGLDDRLSAYYQLCANFCDAVLNALRGALPYEISASDFLISIEKMIGLVLSRECGYYMWERWDQTITTLEQLVAEPLKVSLEVLKRVKELRLLHTSNEEPPIQEQPENIVAKPNEAEQLYEGIAAALAWLHVFDLNELEDRLVFFSSHPMDALKLINQGFSSLHPAVQGAATRLLTVYVKQITRQHMSVKMNADRNFIFRLVGEMFQICGKQARGVMNTVQPVFAAVVKHLTPHNANLVADFLHQRLTFELRPLQLFHTLIHVAPTAFTDPDTIIFNKEIYKVFNPNVEKRKATNFLVLEALIAQKYNAEGEKDEFGERFCTFLLNISKEIPPEQLDHFAFNVAHLILTQYNHLLSRFVTDIQSLRGNAAFHHLLAHLFREASKRYFVEAEEGQYKFGNGRAIKPELVRELLLHVDKRLALAGLQGITNSRNFINYFEYELVLAFLESSCKSSDADFRNEVSVVLRKFVQRALNVKSHVRKFEAFVRQFMLLLRRKCYPEAPFESLIHVLEIAEFFFTPENALRWPTIFIQPQWLLESLFSQLSSDCQQIRTLSLAMIKNFRGKKEDVQSTCERVEAEIGLPRTIIGPRVLETCALAHTGLAWLALNPKQRLTDLEEEFRRKTGEFCLADESADAFVRLCPTVELCALSQIFEDVPGLVELCGPLLTVVALRDKYLEGVTALARKATSYIDPKTASAEQAVAQLLTDNADEAQDEDASEDKTFTVLFCFLLKALARAFAGFFAAEVITEHEAQVIPLLESFFGLLMLTNISPPLTNSQKVSKPRPHA